MAIDHSFKHGTLLPVVHQATPTLHNANYVEVFFCICCSTFWTILSDEHPSLILKREDKYLIRGEKQTSFTSFSIEHDEKNFLR